MALVGVSNDSMDFAFIRMPDVTQVVIVNDDAKPGSSINDMAADLTVDETQGEMSVVVSRSGGMELSASVYLCWRMPMQPLARTIILQMNHTQATGSSVSILLPASLNHCRYALHWLQTT